jgi:hypothetical protein
MPFHGPQIVPRSHFGPENCYTYLLVMVEKEIPVSGVSWVNQGLPGHME